MIQRKSTGPSLRDIEDCFDRAKDCCACRECGALIKDENLRSSYRCSSCEKTFNRSYQLDRRRMKVSEKLFKDEYDRRFRLAKSEDSARLLVACIRDLSESMYCAGWCSNIEFELWMEAMSGGTGSEPAGILSPHLSKPEVAQLRSLARRAGGWWMWWTEPKGCKDQHASGEVFVPMKEWKKVYAEHQKLVQGKG